MVAGLKCLRRPLASVEMTLYVGPGLAEGSGWLAPWSGRLCGQSFDRAQGRSFDWLRINIGEATETDSL